MFNRLKVFAAVLLFLILFSGFCAAYDAIDVYAVKTFRKETPTSPLVETTYVRNTDVLFLFRGDMHNLTGVQKTITGHCILKTTDGTDIVNNAFTYALPAAGGGYGCEISLASYLAAPQYKDIEQLKYILIVDPLLPDETETANNTMQGYIAVNKKPRPVSGAVPEAPLFLAPVVLAAVLFALWKK